MDYYFGRFFSKRTKWEQNTIRHICTTPGQRLRITLLWVVTNYYVHVHNTVFSFITNTPRIQGARHAFDMTRVVHANSWLRTLHRIPRSKKCQDSGQINSTCMWRKGGKGENTMAMKQGQRINISYWNLISEYNFDVAFLHLNAPHINWQILWVQIYYEIWYFSYPIDRSTHWQIFTSSIYEIWYSSYPIDRSTKHVLLFFFLIMEQSFSLYHPRMVHSWYVLLLYKISENYSQFKSEYRML